MTKKLEPVTPGSILLGDFMEPLNLSTEKLAQNLDVEEEQINEVIKNKRAITPDMALRLGYFFKTGPELWLNIQQRYDLKIVQSQIGEQIEKRIIPISDDTLEKASV